MQIDPTIQHELKELGPVLASISNRNVYTVPNGYFNKVPVDIMQAITGETAVSSFNSSVPQGYFENLAGEIMEKIKSGSENESDISSSLQPLRNAQTYRIPAGYFDALSNNIITSIQHLNAIETGESKLLDAVKHINPYHVPAGYFDALPGNIEAMLPQPAKVIVMRRRATFFNYAAAAVITGILGLSLFSIFDKKQTTTDTGTVMAQADKIIKTNSFDEVLSTVSDADIVSYLQSSGEDVNAAMVASAADGKNLPEEVDYLIDDKTLDKLLLDLNIANQSAIN
jgi:hypothetical protein